MIDSYLIDFDNDNKSNNISKIDNKNDLTNELLISDDDEKPIKLKTIKLKEKDNLYSNVKFKKPSSILTSILDLQKDKELQKKLDKMRKKFKLDKFLQKEKDNGINVDDLGRRNSFLDFLKYTQKKTNLNDYLIEEKEKEKRKHEKEVFDLINKNKNEEKKEDLNLTVEEENKKSKNEASNLEEMIENKYQNNISFLSRDSNLSMDKDISLDDIKFLPNEIKEMKIFVSTATTKETIKKNLETNKITSLMRSSVFDRNAVNTNINLTSNEQTNNYKNVNQSLNDNLFVDLREPRRRKNIDLDVSHVREERDYDKILEHKDEDIEIFNKKDNEENHNNFTNEEIIFWLEFW